MFSCKPLATGLSVPVRSEFEFCALCVSGLFDALEPSALERDRQSLTLNFSQVLISQKHSFSPSLFFLHQPLRHGLRIVNWTEKDARVHRDIHNHDVKKKKTKKMIPPVTCEIAFDQHFFDLVF